MSLIQDGLNSVKRLIALFREAGHSPTRETLVGLTDDFTRAVMADTPGAKPEPLYSIYVGQKEVGAGGVHHTFVRLVGPDGKVACDIHGLRCPRPDGHSPLEVMIEPMDFEYFAKMKSDGDMLVWQGGADAAGYKMKRAIALVQAINASPRPYSLLTQSCNTVMHSMLEVMDLELPEEREGWMPGIGRLFTRDIEIARQAADRNNVGNVAWLDRFMTALRTQRTTVEISLQALRR